jgi:hypothetical protein
MSKLTKYRTLDGLWGPATCYTRIDEDGKMWIGNDEYESQVNFCPVTGEKAPTQMVFKLYSEKLNIHYYE